MVTGMTEFDGGRLKTILGRMRAFQQSLPERWTAFPARYAEEYGRMIEDLRRAGFETTHLALPAGAAYLTRERGLLPPQIDRTVLMSAVSGAIAFIESMLEKSENEPFGPAAGFGPIIISGGNVTFGDGSNVNITTVTMGDLLKGLQSHVEATAPDPGDPSKKESLLAQINNLLKHPASTTILQVGVPELLKRLFGG